MRFIAVNHTLIRFYYSINIYSVEPLLLYYYLLLRQVYVVCISVPV